MLDYGFTCLGLHNIFLWVNAANERGIRAYRRAGFRWPAAYAKANAWEAGPTMRSLWTAWRPSSKVAS